jgi:heterodisulfide reductase subunit C2
MAHRMDLMPSQIVRLVQLGQVGRTLRAEAIWQCLSCQTCTSRCPKSVDCAGLMDVLRQLACQDASASPVQLRTRLFLKAFLQNIRRNGRLNEIELIGTFKASALLNDLSIAFLFKDALLAPALMKRKKFHLTGEKVRDRGVVQRIFERCM